MRPSARLAAATAVLALVANEALAKPKSRDAKAWQARLAARQKDVVDARKVDGLVAWLACRGSDQWPECEKAALDAGAGVEAADTLAAAATLGADDRRRVLLSSNDRLLARDARPDRCDAGLHRRLADLAKAGWCVTKPQGRPDERPFKLDVKLLPKLRELAAADPAASGALARLEGRLQRGLNEGRLEVVRHRLLCVDAYDAVFGLEVVVQRSGRHAWFEVGSRPEKPQTTCIEADAAP